MRALVFLHRWLGVALCLLFIVWFPSGIGMMYWDFPAITPADRLARSPALDGSTIALSPSQAFAVLGLAQAPAQVRIGTFDGRPVYRFGVGRSERTVYADTGDERGEASPDLMMRAAARWSGRREEAAIEQVVDPDQWTVQGPLRNLRPLWKYSWPDGQQVYVAQSTGEVVQYTTSASRLGAYLGPIPHWLYFTPLRSRQTAWSRVVIWSSGIGTIGAILGLAIGIARYSPSRRYRYADVPTSIPYRGQKRWHMALGLIFGLGAATWAVSGMLSMDPFPALNGDGEGRRTDTAVAGALRGPIDLAAFDRKPPRAALAQLSRAPVKELELATFDGHAVYIAAADRGATQVVPIDGEPRTDFDRERIAQLVADAAAPHGASVRVLDRYDAYYLDRRGGLPLPVVVAEVRDADRTRYYIDPKTARIAGSYSSRAWATRWLYHALHSLDFPWLYAHRPAWDIIVITFMLGGTALSVTSLVLAWRVIAAL
jgi:hypothetical protein